MSVGTLPSLLLSSSDFIHSSNQATNPYSSCHLFSNCQSFELLPFHSPTSSNISNGIYEPSLLIFNKAISLSVPESLDEFNLVLQTRSLKNIYKHLDDEFVANQSHHTMKNKWGF